MKALLVVSFGTSFAGVAERTIGAVERALEAAFPERTIASAWTSKFICIISSHFLRPVRM